MKLLFVAVVLAYTFFFSEIETSVSQKKLRTEKASSSKGDDKEPMEASTMNMHATLKRRKYPSSRRIPSQFQHIIDPTGESAYHSFLQYYSKNNLPSPEVGREALELHDRLADGSYRYGMRNDDIVSRRVAQEKAYKSYRESIIQHHSGQHSPPGCQSGVFRSGNDHQNTYSQNTTEERAWDVYKQYEMQLFKNPL